MAPSLNIALPSIHRVNKQTNFKTEFKLQKREPLQFQSSRNHARTTSMPSVLPSYQDSNKLSMDVLLDAIDLDQQMRQFFRTEVIKSKSRTTSAFVPPSIMMARRRSKSAPGAPPSYHQQRAFNSRWTTPNCTVTSASAAQEVAKLIVQQHFESVKKR
jgi:predicted ATPase with chaperone activity